MGKSLDENATINQSIHPDSAIYQSQYLPTLTTIPNQSILVISQGKDSIPSLKMPQSINAGDEQ